MKQMDSLGIKLCIIQANFFENSVNEFIGSSAIFIRRFAYSKLAKRMDQIAFLFGSDNPKDLYKEIEDEFGKTSYGSEKYKRNELFWIGYIYRYWSYTYEISTYDVYKIVKPSELRLLYFPYHSLDPKQAIERILESKNIKEIDYIARGVELLKAMKKDKNSKKIV